MPDTLELLLKEYDARRQEVMEVAKRYHQQTNFTYLYATIVITLGVAAISPEKASGALKDLRITGTALNAVFVLVLAVAAMVGFYLFWSVIDALQTIYLNGCRLSALERLINREANQDVLVWDSKICKRVFSFSFVGGGLWIKSNVFVAVFVYLLFFTANTTLCVLYKAWAPFAFNYYLIAVGGLSAFTLVQGLSLMTVGLKQLQSIVDEESGLSLRSDELQARYWSWKYFSIAVATLLAGVVPMGVLSLVSGAFWSSAKIPFPFLSNASVAVGDGILLPLANMYLAQVCALNRQLFTKQRRKTVPLIAAATAIAGFVHYRLHQIWASDAFAGWTDLLPGVISKAGYVHIVYSAVQTVAIILVLAAVVFRNYLTDESKVGLRRATTLVLLYSLLGVIDFVIKQNITKQPLLFQRIVSENWFVVLKIVTSAWAWYAARQMWSTESQE